jgi:hypothetical protein
MKARRKRAARIRQRLRAQTPLRTERKEWMDSAGYLHEVEVVFYQCGCRCTSTDGGWSPSPDSRHYFRPSSVHGSCFLDECDKHAKETCQRENSKA